MKPRHISWYLFVSFLLAGPLLAQDKPEPLMVDEFQRTNCEDVLARLDNFIVELQNNPNSKGYIVTSGEPYPRRTAEREMKNAVRNKIGDPRRIVFANGEGSGSNARVAFWMIPPGADAPKFSPAAVNSVDVKSRASTKPYIFGSTSADEIKGCSSYDLEFYADTLKANPASRGNIVIYEKSRRKFREKEDSILLELAKSRIARKRLRTFYVRVKSGRLREGIELWLLP